MVFSFRTDFCKGYEANGLQLPVIRICNIQLFMPTIVYLKLNVY